MGQAFLCLSSSCSLKLLSPHVIIWDCFFIKNTSQLHKILYLQLLALSKKMPAHKAEMLLPSLSSSVKLSYTRYLDVSDTAVLIFTL